MKLQIILSSLVVCTLGATSKHLGWKIVGGENAGDGEFPYQVSLRYAGSHSCGGSILDETTILCAAHCVFIRNATRMTVRVGTNKLDGGGDEYPVASHVYHSGFGPTLQNDIAIIKLKTPIKFNEKVKPINLRRENIGGGEDCVLSGWGTTWYEGPTPNDLQKIKLKTLSVEDCAAKQSNTFDTEVCTLTKRGEGACHGDSGGPLVDSEGRQFGIVSWGYPCAEGYPDVFTRVFSFLDWIEENR